MKKFGTLEHALYSFGKDKSEDESTPKLLQVYCYEPWCRIHINSIGGTSPCCLSEYVHEENAKEKSLKDIWLGGYFSEFRRKILNNEFPASCSSCNVSLFMHSKAIQSKLKTRWAEEQANIKKEKETVSIPIRRRVSKDGGLNICLISREYPVETGWGGIGEYTYQLAEGLSERGHNVHVVALSLNGDREYMQGDIFVHRISHRDFFPFKRPLLEFSTRLEYSLRLYGKLKEVIKRYDIDIVEAPNFFAEGFIYSLFKKTPLVTRVHTPYRRVIESYGWRNSLQLRASCLLEDSVVMHSDLVTSSTNICAETISQDLGFTPGRVAVIPLGIVMPDRTALGDKAGLSRHNATAQVLFVGRLEHRKGAHILMRAIPLVLEEMPDAQFTFVGRDTFLNSRYSAFEGQRKESFKEALLAELPEKYMKKVIFPGHIEKEELGRYFESCDIFVAPSLYESFGLVYIEAMSYGKPVIGCGVGGVPEVVKDGQTGILVPPEDHARLAEAIIRLLKDPQERMRLGGNARRHVEQNYSREKMVERTLVAYKRVLEKR